MSSSTTPVAPPQGFRLRLWPLLLILGLAAAVAVGVWTLPQWDHLTQVLVSYALVFFTVLAVCFWYVFLSGMRWWFGLLTLPLIGLGVWGASYLLVREVRFSGDMEPTLHFIWDEQPEDRLRRHRAQQGEQPAVPVPAVAVAQDDFPAYRGRKRDGVADGPALARDWKAKPPKKVWSQPCGIGWGAFAVAGGRAVTIEERDNKEAIVCYDTKTGHELWAHLYEGVYRPADGQEALGGPGPRSTPTIADGEVYAVGGTGVLNCLDLATGKPRWTKNILDGNKNIIWAISGSPLVDSERVIVGAGKQRPNDKDRTLVAYSRKTGEELWAKGTRRTGYSSPQSEVIAGVPHILLFDGDGLGGYDAATGDELWWYKWETNQGINVAQPLLIDDNRLFVTSGYNVGCAVLKVELKGKTWTVAPEWQNKNMRCQFTTPVLYKGHAYGLDAGILVCVDVATGERKWRGGRFGHGQLLRSDDLLVLTSESGDLALVEATPEAYRELGRVKVFTSKTWNLPALAGGRVYMRNDQEMACYDITE
jgi:outer membrane protein assembly factor BamB